MSKSPKTASPSFGAGIVNESPRSGLTKVLTWIVLAVVLVGGGFVGWKAWQFFNGRERDPKYEPEHPVNLDAVDLALVHHELLGSWSLRQEHKFEMRNAEQRIASATERVWEAIAPDQNLTALFDELEELVAEGKLRQGAKRDQALWLTRAWNQYLDANDEPYFLRAFVVLHPQAEFHLYGYEKVGELTASLDGEAERVRLLSRIDEVNRRELFHGSTPSEGAVVRIDWVVQFALDEVWPLLGEPDPTSPRRQLFAPAVVKEAEAALSEEHMAVLRATADVRREAVRAHREIRERRRCSGFVVARQPWDGFDGDSLAELSSRVGVGRCPAVYPSELEALDKARNALTETDGLEPALQALAQWLLRTHVIHELRHVDAGIDIYDEGRKARCSVCAADASNIHRAEVSAIVAEWAWSDSPATTLLRFCYDDEAVADGPLEVALKALEHSCGEGPHEDLTAAARALEEKTFGQSTPITVDATPDKPVPLDRSVVLMREAE